MEKETVYDVIIVGGGPIGIWAAYYSGFRGLNTVLLESSESLGGQAIYLYPEKVITDLPGIPAITGRELVEKLIQQMNSVEVRTVLNARVLSIGKENDIRRVFTSKGDYAGRFVILTPGLGNFVPNRLGLPEVDAFEGKGVYYFVKSKEDFRGKDVVIVGGGDSAVDWALELAPLAKTVYLVHRRNEFRAAQSNLKKLEKLGVKFVVPYVVKGVAGNESLERVFLSKVDDGSILEIEAQSMLMMLGYKLDLSSSKSWGVEVSPDGILIDSNCMTSDPKIYAAGDIAAPREGIKQKLLVIGFAQATTAINSISKNLHSYEPAFVHSTNIKSSSR